MKKFLNKAEGFTLVELIVVIAILGILAGVAVPAYTGYIKKANDAADITICDAVKTAVFAAYAEEGDASPAYIGVADGAVYVAEGTAIAGDYATNFEVYYGDTIANIEIDNESAVWQGGDWVLTPES